MVNTQLHLTPRLKICGDKTLLLLYAITEWEEKILPFSLLTARGTYSKTASFIKRSH